MGVSLKLIFAVSQAALLIYLVAVRPYIEWQLQWLEVSCAALELALYVCAMLLMGSSHQIVITSVMIGEGAA